MSDREVGSGCYRPLLEEMRPHYCTQADLRLLRRAYRNGWVDGVPPARQREWLADVEKVCDEARSSRTLASVVKVYLEMMKHHVARDVAALEVAAEALQPPSRRRGRTTKQRP